jgi:3-phenylpropionate/trans-cinnamate dioxygenase ferredoxin subunit
MTAVDLYGVPVAIASVGGVFYAFSDACPYAACSLSQGLLDGKIVTCRTDGSQFDLVSGHVLTGPAKARVRTYRIQVHGDDLSI